MMHACIYEVNAMISESLLAGAIGSKVIECRSVHSDFL